MLFTHGPIKLLKVPETKKVDAKPHKKKSVAHSQLQAMNQ